METISDYYKGLLSGSSLSLHDIQNAVLDRRGKKGGIKMVESQSRYGIMEELSQTKMEAKREIADLEAAQRQQVLKFNQNIADMERQLLQRTSSYRAEHQSWKVLKDLEQKNILANAQNLVAKIIEEVKSADERLEPDFKTWKSLQEIRITDAKANLVNYQTEQAASIKAKTEAIAEIDSAIASLKEISKENK